MKTSALAVTSLVLGILALLACFIGPLFGLPAVICGHIALSQIGRSGGGLTGKGMAIAGLVTGYLSVALMLLLLPIAIPNFIRARAVAQKNQCVQHLRAIDAAKSQWAMEHRRDGNATPTEADLKPYLNNTFPQCPAGGTYTINPVHVPPSCTVAEHQLP